MNSPLSSQRPHIVWLDVLRFVAIFMVIMSHSADPFNASPESRANPDFNLWGSAFGSFVRACVPLFVMMTGLLLLPVKQEAGPFYKKRILRVLYPFLVWSVLFNLAPWFIQWVGGTPQLVTTFFPFGGEPSASLTDGLKAVAMIPLNFNMFACPMWYIYLLIGLYLYMPIFSAWVEKASDKSKRLFLGLWVITLLLPYGTQFISPYLFGACSWNAYGTFYSFAGFNGYLLLGHYLGKGNDWSWGKTLLITIPMFAVGYLITFKGFRAMSSDPNVTDARLELFWTYCSINTMLMTTAVFLLIQKVRVTSDKLSDLLAQVAKCSFGMYLCHYFFIGPAYLLTVVLHTPVALQIPFTAVLVLLASWGLVSMIYKLPKAKYIVG
ncbi:acyltransferase [Bacteroides sedimenti]|uniref:Acyltransferase 3 domain-containing protein n=1 Tax=Bacteroides sedimenti TaxID=2136147 RepID=A0ABM8IAK2_9BACE